MYDMIRYDTFPSRSMNPVRHSRTYACLPPLSRQVNPNRRQHTNITHHTPHRDDGARVPGGGNTGALLLGAGAGRLGAWRFHSHKCADRYFAEGPEAFRIEGMVIHPETQKGA